MALGTRNARMASLLQGLQTSGRAEESALAEVICDGIQDLKPSEQYHHALVMAVELAACARELVQNLKALES